MVADIYIVEDEISSDLERTDEKKKKKKILQQ